MEFRRALRILKARWWLIALTGVLGAAVAVAAAVALNDRTTPEYEARASVEYLRIESETTESFNSRLADARTTALDILDGAGQSVTVDEDSRLLTFTMTGPDPEPLVAEVTRLREEFLATDSDQERFEEATTAELARLQSEIDDVRAQLTEQTPPAASTDPATSAERDQLSFEINSLRQKVASLRIQLAFPELATAATEALQADLDRSQELLVRLTAGLQALPSESVTSTTASLDTLVLQRHLQDLESRYVSFSLGLLDQPDVIGPISPAFAVDNTRAPIALRLAAPGGMLAGFVVMGAMLLVTDRVKRPLWTVEDIDSAVPVGAIARARPGANGRPWYPRATRSERRRQVQAFRSALDPILAERSVSIGLSGVSVLQEDVHALAADLAVSVAASGTRVLLVDAALGSPSDLPEFGDDEPDLARLISGGDRAGAVEAIKRALVDRGEVVPELTSVRAGSGIGDATDALAGPRFRALLGIAGELDQLVIVAGGPFGDPGTEVLSQRLDHMVLVCRSRHTTLRDFLAASDELTHRSATLSGVALLKGRHSKKRRSGSAILAGFRGYGRHRARPGESDDADSDENTTADEYIGDDETVGSIVEPDSPAEPSIEELRADEQLTDGTVGEGLMEPAIDEPPAVASDTGPGVGLVSPPAQTVGSSSRTVGPTDLRSATGPDHGRHVRSLQDQGSTHADELTAEADPGFEVVIDDRDPTASDREDAERYLVTQVLRMLGVEGGPLDEPVRSVAHDEMTMITVEDGEPNAAETLSAMLASDELSRPSNVDRGLRSLLGGRVSTWQLHRWLETRFFGLHTETMAGNPLVWHVSTANGAFQVLIRADRLDPDRVQALRSRVRKTSDRLVLAIADAGRAGDLDQVEAIEERLREVRALNDLLFGLWREEWRVGGDLDRAAKLAVMRDLGVIPAVPALDAD